MTFAQPVRAGVGPFVGRETEVARLCTAYEEATRQGERLVLVRGESGVGKTRLLSEVKGRLRLQGAPVLEGHCLEGGRAFAPFGEILSAGLAFLDEVGRPPALDLGPMLFSLGARAPMPEPVEAHAAGSEHERRVRFFDTFRAFLSAVAEVRSPIVVLHDLHRADPGSLELLRWLVDGNGTFLEDLRPHETVRALFVASMRSDVASQPALAELHAHARAQTLELGGIGAKGLRELLESPAIIERIMTLTGGRPDDIEALLATPPGRTEDRLRRRVSALPERARRLVSALAVVNRPVGPAVLEKVSGVRATGAEMAELAGSGLVHKAVVDGELQLSFLRPSERDLVYGEIDAATCAALHRGYAAILEAEEPVGLALQDVAFHHLRAGDAAPAARRACDAADALCRAYAHDAAAVLLEQALEIAEGDDAAAIRERLVTAYRAAGDHAKALESARVLRALRGNDPVVMRRMGELYTLAGEYDAAERELEEARKMALKEVESYGASGAGFTPAERAPSSEEGGIRLVAGAPTRGGGGVAPAVDAKRVLAEIDAELSEVAYQKGDYDRAQQVATRAMSQADLLDLPGVTLAARNTVGKVHLSRGEFGAAAEVFAENAEAAQAAGVELEELRAAINLAIAHLRRQELAAAEELFEKASRIADARGSLHYQAICRENLAVLAHTKGEYDRALELYHDAVGLLKKLGNRPLLGRVAANLGWLYLLLGDTPRARSLADLSANVGNARAPVRFKNLVLVGNIELAEGRSEGAGRALAEALVIARQLGDGDLVQDYLIAAGKLALHDGDVAGARRVLSQVGKVESPVMAAQFAVLRADVERAAGCDPYPASARAVELAERAGDASILWRAHLRLARALADRGDAVAAQRHAKRAGAIDAAVSERVPEAFRACYECLPERIELRRLTGSERDSQTPAPVASLAERQPSAVVVAAPAFDRYPKLVGSSRPMRSVCGIIDKVAPADSIVLIRGESGTGKELVAEAIHAGSPRRDRPLVKVNCAALVETLLLSELFGHERGAFTGALTRKKGRFELADGGTLFLDEIGDISPKTQVSLLRVLQEREFERVGGTTAVRVDVRILCATNRNLEQAVERGLFREDLYYRLKGLQVEMPALRERLDDVPILAEHFLRKVGEERGEAPRRLTVDALEVLRRHAWPGNVREFENTIRSVTLFAEGPVLTAEHFAEYAGLVARPDTLAAAAAVANAAAPVADGGNGPDTNPAFGQVRGGDVSLRDLKRNIEKECITQALRETKGNITKAAALLGMKRPRLSQLVKQYGLSIAEGGR